MNSRPDDCAFCRVEDDLAASPPRERLYVSDAWRIVVHKSALPGWALIIPRRHIESLDVLHDDEAAELGRLIRDLSRVFVEELGALKSYVMQFAEGTPHAHFSLVPRMLDIPAERIGAKSMAYNVGEGVADDQSRDELAIRLASVWPSEVRGIAVLAAR